jgi:pyruvate/2-oxoglutarate dehydrogenase complex dihydrolipoamide dehydrogenase (E3) component
MAQAHRRLGSAVTVIEAAKVFARDDVDCAAVVIDALMAEGIVIHQQALISAIEKTPVGIRVSLHEKAAIEGTHLLLATGRKSNIEGLELPAGNVASDARGISVDRSLRSTTNRRVYAAGDVAGSLQFTHAANYHAGLIIRNALFRLPTRNQTDMLPWVTYTDPELAQVGLTEGTARRLHGDTIKVLTSHFSDNDRARTGGKTEGLVKVVTTARGVILGCSIAGPGAGEQIAMWSLAVSRKLKISAIAGLVLPYPSRTEAGKRAAVSYYADLPQSSWARRLIGLLKRFG